jgi:stage V sporulation protein AF
MREALQAEGSAGRRGLVRDLDANVQRFNAVLGYGKSYDLILRRLRVAGVDVALYVINGFFDSVVNLDLLSLIAGTGTDGAHGPGGPPDLPAHADAPPSGAGGSRLRLLRALVQDRLSYSQVSVVRDFDEAILQLLSGPMVMLVDGEPAAIIIDTRTYPDRNPTAPNTEQVIHGPEDGFVENIIYNTALIRRRVRDPGLRFEMVQVGRRSRTDVAVAYIEGLTNPELVRRVKQRLKDVDLDGIPMAEQPVAELLGGQPWNPFPTSRLTERPDVAASNLYDGHVVVVVDTTPVAIIAPISLFQLLQHPEDYHVAPVFGTYVRWIEFYAVLWAVLIPPFWLLLATHPGILSRFPALSFIGPKQPPKVPLPLQFFLAEFSIDLLRRAILNSPGGLATSFGILGAVVIGDVATKTGLFSPEALVYMVGAAIASFAVSSVELGMALRLVRLSLLALEWLWSLPGVVVGLLFWFVLAARTDSLGVAYLWPVVPFSWPSLRSVLIREPVRRRTPRPVILHPEDPRLGRNGR